MKIELKIKIAEIISEKTSVQYSFALKVANTIAAQVDAEYGKATREGCTIGEILNLMELKIVGE